jgi:ABC-type multidrug transport system fused ATPase/permease subunit
MMPIAIKALIAAVGNVEGALARPRRRMWRWFDRDARRAAAPPAPPPQRATPDRDPLEPSIYRFILRYSLRQQVVLLLLTLLSFPFLYYSLELPKIITNKAIKPHYVTQTVFGHPLAQIPYLMLLCFAFLLLVFINGAFKYYLNTYKGRLGERMLRRFRYQLYQRMLAFPLSYFHKNSSAQIIPMITAECDTLGGFAGDAVAMPAFQGGTLLTNLVFMFMQDPVLGAAAVALYPVQGYLIPKLQRKVNQLNRMRVRTVRQVADRVQETASGMADIVANDAAKLQLSYFAHLLGTIYDIRFESYQRKFFAKFLNNFLGQLTPFFFYAIGGYLVIRGSLSIGGLVAVLIAYKDLASPFNELLVFYQSFQDSRIKYEQIVEQFAPPGMIEQHLQLDEPETVVPLAGELTVANLSLAEDDRSRILDAITFTVPLDRQIAVIGQSGSGKSELAQVLARLIAPSRGRITMGGTDLASLPATVVGRRIGYVGPAPYLFAGTMRDNLLVGLRHAPTRPAQYGPVAGRRRARQLAEAAKAGNIDLDIHADWVDYKSAGVADREELSHRITEVLAGLGCENDVYGLGLRWRLDPEAEPEAAQRLLEARKALAHRLADDGISHLVETYDVKSFNRNASVAENLLFGTPIGPAFDFDALADNNYVLQVLAKVGLVEDLLAAGREVAETMVELFADLPPDHAFFEQYSFISANDLPEFAAILARAEKGGIAALAKSDRTKLLSLPFKLIPARHRLDVIDEAMQQRLLAARRVFHDDLPVPARAQIEFFDAVRYNAAASVQDNILFGKIAYGEADAPVRVPAALAEVVDALDLRQTVIEVGLDYNVGPGGSRLSLAQRQMVGIARAVLKRPDLLILNEATSALDGQAQASVMKGIKEECAGRSIIWVLHRASLARNFDHVLVLSNGKLQEQGNSAELFQRKDSLLTLLAATE